MGQGGGKRLAGHPSRTAVRGPLVRPGAGGGIPPRITDRHEGPITELSRWLENQGLSADALAPLLRYLRGPGAAPWTGPQVAASARGGQRNEALVPVAC